MEKLQSKEEAEQMCNDHAEWFCKIIKPILSTFMEHGYKHGHEDGYMDGVHETMKEVAKKKRQSINPEDIFFENGIEKGKVRDLKAEFKRWKKWLRSETK